MVINYKIIFLFLILPFLLLSQEIDYEIRTVQQGIMKFDSKGFMWAIRNNLLIRYDGYSYKTFNHDPNDPFRVSSGLINSLYEDRENRNIFWIGTSKGLFQFDVV